MTSLEPLAYFHLIKFSNLHNLVTILNFLMGLRLSVSLIPGFSINRNFKKVFLKVHKTFRIFVYLNMCLSILKVFIW